MKLETSRGTSPAADLFTTRSIPRTQIRDVGASQLPSGGFIGDVLGALKNGASA
jgi:hypothetical protein